MDNAYVSRLEYDEHSKRMEDEHRRMNHRLSDLEKGTEENHKLLVSVEKMALNMEIMQKEQISQGKRLEVLEGRDGKKWRKVVEYVGVTILGILIGFLGKHLGM